MGVAGEFSYTGQPERGRKISPQKTFYPLSEKRKAAPGFPETASCYLIFSIYLA